MGDIHPRVVAIYSSEANIPSRLQRIRHDENTSQAAREFVEHLSDHVVTRKRNIEAHPLPDDRSLIGQGLLWAGTPGSGKTHEAAATLAEILNRYGSSNRVYFVAYADYIEQRKRQWAMGDKPGMEGRWAQIQCMVEHVEEGQVLLMDDVGKEMDGASRFAANELERLLRKRHREGLPTLVTTNLKPKEWADTFDSESLGDFIKEGFVVIPMTGPSRRGARSEHSPSSSSSSPHG